MKAKIVCLCISFLFFFLFNKMQYQFEENSGKRGVSQMEAGVPRNVTRHRALKFMWGIRAAYKSFLSFGNTMDFRNWICIWHIVSARWREWRHRRGEDRPRCRGRGGEQGMKKKKKGGRVSKRTMENWSPREKSQVSKKRERKRVNKEERRKGKVSNT